MSIPRAGARVLAGAGIAVGAAITLALPASAHVTINPNTAQPGGYGSFNVQVPNEEAGANTTMVQLYLPTDHPIASVSVEPVPGWTVNVVNSKLATPIKTDDGEVTQAVSQITWSGGKIAPGQFQRFGVSMGPLPTGVSVLRFKALQTYTDQGGKTSVVRWIEIPSAGGPEPAHPAPSVTLAAAPSAAPVAATTTKTTSSSDGTATGLAIAGLVVGVAALGVAAAAVRRTRGGSA